MSKEPNYLPNPMPPKPPAPPPPPKKNGQEYLEKLKKEASRALDEGENFQNILKLFPDVEVHRDRWETIRFATNDVNPQVDKVEIRHSCGCCNDAPLLAFPYIILASGEKVYGEQNAYGYGEKEYPGWEEEMRKGGICEVAIKQVREYLDAHKPEEYEDEDNE